MKLQLDRIDISVKINEFVQYLNTTDRIILSAKFGDGKTYFLNELRKDKDLSDDYEFYTVYPVNYSVAKTEDVFEYIKRDIILQMSNKKQLDNIDLDAFFEAVKSFVDISSVVSFLLSFVPCGNLYNNIIDRFERATKTYKEKRHTSVQYLSMFKNQRGGLYEDDGYTELIKETLRWVKEDHGNDHKGKKTVLIIEDLDRLDPQHLFRILNVLSAHIDDTSEPDKVSNKFGFDNIVLVMDYETTEHIFHHFYGEKANYSGYMSKFLARAPFRYSIKELARNQLIEKIGQTLKIEGTILHMNAFLGNIAEMSLRDLMKIASFDTKERRPKDALKVNSMSFSTDLPIFSLVLLMIECGMDNDSIVNELTSSYGYDSIEYLRLIAPLCFLNEQNLSFVSFEDGTYKISTKAEENVINAITVTIVINHQATPFSNYDIQTPLVKLLNGGFSESITTSSAYKRVTEKQ
ncbi:MAG: hypothetical protein IKK04_07035 [Bacteroidales bacterium]|nr:hypothetical protein [Bacteroidales bacterium]